jgi:hypothetical protein
MNKIKALGLCGLARCGKDSFFSIANAELSNMGYKAVKLSFAEALRSDLDEFLLKKTGISAFTEKGEEKEIIRDFLVAYGTKLMRRIDQDYWIKKLKQRAYILQSQGHIPVFTDVRYPNELDWVKNDLQGLIVHISRSNNVAPNDEEALNDPILSSNSDHKFWWSDFEDLQPSGQDVMAVKNAIHYLLKSKGAELQNEMR